MGLTPEYDGSVRIKDLNSVQQVRDDLQLASDLAGGNTEKISVGQLLSDVTLTGEASGAIASFSDALDASMKSCTVSIEPVQDLHGYDRPWAGGAGKNLLPTTVDGIKAANTSGTWSGNVYTINQCTFEILTDIDSNVIGIKANGTPNEVTRLFLWTLPIFSGTLIMSGCPNNQNEAVLLQYANMVDGAVSDSGQGANITQYNPTTYPNASISALIRSGMTASNAIFYPMVRQPTATSTFEPYSNVCPITGHDEVTVQNLTTIQSYYDIQSLVRSGDAQKVFKIGDEIPVKYTATNGTQYDMPFRVVDFKEVELEDGTTKTGMFLQSKYATLEAVQFDAPEPDNTLGSGGVKDDKVASYGYNRWSESGIRAWLNSGATVGNWWSNTFERGGQIVNRRVADVAPTQLASINGFLRGLPSTFVDVLGKVKMQTSCNTVTDGGITDVTYDKVFLASLEQMYTTPQVSEVEGSYFAYWKQALGLESPSSTYPSTYEAYKTYALENHNSAQYVRLRSAYRNYSYITWDVYSSGSIYYGYNAYHAFRSAPVCVIV